MLKISLLTSFLASVLPGYSQKNYQYSLTVQPETCSKGSALLFVSNIEANDSVSVLWSTGEKNVSAIHNLSAGNYFVRHILVHFRDSLRFVSDTTLPFLVEKKECPVYIDTYFSPNNDGYHDVMGITNTEYFPYFELLIFNKWGQQIHSQSNTYTPWDGKWNGAEVPDGAYYYIFFFDKNKRDHFLKNSVNIIR